MNTKYHHILHWWSKFDHEKVVALVNNNDGKRVESKPTPVKLASVYLGAGLEDSFLHNKENGGKLIEIDFNNVLKEVLIYAPILKLKTLDMIHATKL